MHEYDWYDYYEILELEPEAGLEEIRTAYRRLVKRYHPDVFDGDPEEAHERMAAINEAYDALYRDAILDSAYERDESLYWDPENPENQQWWSAQNADGSRGGWDADVEWPGAGLFQNPPPGSPEEAAFVSRSFAAALILLLVIAVGLICLINYSRAPDPGAVDRDANRLAEQAAAGYSGYYRSYIDTLTRLQAEDARFRSHGAVYTLYDMDGDGTLEMLVRSERFYRQLSLKKTGRNSAPKGSDGGSDAPSIFREGRAGWRFYTLDPDGTAVELACLKTGENVTLDAGDPDRRLCFYDLYETRKEKRYRVDILEKQGSAVVIVDTEDRVYPGPYDPGPVVGAGGRGSDPDPAPARSGSIPDPVSIEDYTLFRDVRL